MRARAMLFGKSERRVNQKCEIVQAFKHFFGILFFLELFLPASNLHTRSSKIDVLANVRLKVVHLAEIHALLAKDIVGGGHVEEEVRNQPSVDVAGSGNVDALARAETD